MSHPGGVALVTGAGGGIGAACAPALAAEGWRVAVGYRNDKDGAAAVAEELEGAISVRIDVTDPGSVEAAFEEIETKLGPVLVLVNNAGITRDRPAARMSEEDWAEVIETDLTGVFRCTRRALRPMLAKGFGRIISIGSVVAATGNPGQSNYAAAKAGVEGFTKSLAAETARYGVTANVVAPGLVKTDLTSSLPEEAFDALLKRIAMRRPGTTGEIAEAVCFCVRASYMTGQVVPVNGGIA